MFIEPHNLVESENKLDVPAAIATNLGGVLEASRRRGLVSLRLKNGGIQCPISWLDKGGVKLLISE